MTVRETPLGPPSPTTAGTPDATRASGRTPGKRNEGPQPKPGALGADKPGSSAEGGRGLRATPSENCEHDTHPRQDKCDDRKVDRPWLGTAQFVHDIGH